MNEGEILIVEDEGLVAKDIQRRLEALGYRVGGVASSGEEALRKATEFQPALALLDIKLKGAMDGIELAQQLRDRYRIPVIYLTAYADDVTVQRVKKTEPLGYLIKPFDERELQTAIELALYKHRMELQLRESKAWLAAALYCIGDAVIATDEQGLIRLMNPVAQDLTGWTATQALGRPLKDVFCIVNEETRLPVESPVAQALNEGGIVGLADEAVLIGRNGAERVIYGSASPIRSPKGKTVGVVLAFRDITERRRAEEALRVNEERYRDLCENAHDLIYTTDLAGNLLSVNKATERLTGYSRDEAFQMNFADLVTPEYCEAVGQALARQLGGEGHTAQELEIITKDGRRVLLEASTRLRFSHGKPVGTQSIARDITERKRSEQMLAQKTQELERSNAELEQFAYIASHDLQEPLRVMSNHVQLLARHCQGKLDAEAEESIGFALDAAARMQRLIKDLLAYSRVSTRGRQLQPTDSETVLECALQNLGGRIEETGATITHDPLPVVRADMMQLGQVFQNLISNALKFHGEAKPHVHVSAQKNGTSWVFAIKDNGMGIEPSDFERIFKVFERGLNGHTRPGTGIGLSICKRIVERHGGKIWLQSEPGRGSTFLFSMPSTETAHE